MTRKTWKRAMGWEIAIGLSIGVCHGGAEAEVLRINGSTTVNPPVAEAAEILREDRDMEIIVDTQGGSSGGMAALGSERVEIAMSSKPVSRRDRERYPGVDFNQIPIGADAVAVVVSRDVWESGVRSLSRAEVQQIYEKEETNWQAFGGMDQRILFYNKEPGRGTWEVFADWLYGDSQDAPLVSFPRVGGNEEGRTKVASSKGAMTQLSASWADEERVFALGIETKDGTVVRPRARNVTLGRYPIRRTLYLLTDGKPSGAAKVMVDFMVSSRGQELVEKHGYLSLQAVECETKKRATLQSQAANGTQDNGQGQ